MKSDWLLICFTFVMKSPGKIKVYCPYLHVLGRHHVIIHASHAPGNQNLPSETKAPFTKDWIQLQIGTDTPCVYTGPGRSALNQFSFPLQNESDPVWNFTVLEWYRASVNPTQFSLICACSRVSTALSKMS